jgi:hypothetical protein
MVPHKSSRGAAALTRLALFEGVPPAQDKVKKMVVPAALRVLRLKPGRKYCTLKRLSHEVGWGYKDVVDKLEEKRKAKGQAYHERKVSHGRAISGPPMNRTADMYDDYLFSGRLPQAPRKGCFVGQLRCRRQARRSRILSASPTVFRNSGYF